MLVIRDPQPDTPELEYVRRALGDGQLVVVPTDTVYGLAVLAADEAAVTRMYETKGRGVDQPTAVVYCSVEDARTELPGLSSRASWALASLCPGPWTLVVRNPDERYPWLTGGSPGPLGIRVPAGALRLPPIAATSANAAGAPTATTVASLDPELMRHLACAIDRGTLGAGAMASTVLDLTAWERDEGPIRVIRDDANRAPGAISILEQTP